MTVRRNACAMLALALGVSGCTRPQPPAATRPNILLIVADDVGFTDIGAYGSEIQTPVLDRLAQNGLKFSRFRASAACSPTRASLMSGADPHVAGLGNMAEDLAPNQKAQPGYEGYLNFAVAPLPAVLHRAGYRTYMAGKWHLGLEEQTESRGPGLRPQLRDAARRRWTLREHAADVGRRQDQIP